MDDRRCAIFQAVGDRGVDLRRGSDGLQLVREREGWCGACD